MNFDIPIFIFFSPYILNKNQFLVPILKVNIFLSSLFIFIDAALQLFVCRDGHNY
jgi:hypothetical protein